MWLSRVVIDQHKDKAGRFCVVAPYEVVLGTFRNTGVDGSGTLGNIQVSTHAIYWHPVQFSDLFNMPLERIGTFQIHNSIFRKVHRVDLQILDANGITPVRIELHDNDSKEFKRVLTSALTQKLWLKPVHAPAKVETFFSREAGVAGIISRQAQEREEKKRMADGAFDDLEALMSKAGELVALIERYSTALEKSKVEDEEPDEEEEFNRVLNDIGIVNPVTKRSAGSRYHEALAIELSEFLQGSLASHSKAGMITLPDLYCIANRARGTALVSPNDLYQACESFGTLKLPYVLKKLASGVMVVQSASHEDGTIVADLKMLIEVKGFSSLSSTNVAEELAIPLILAKEYLITAEKMMYLCRDQTITQTTFYVNRFTTPAVNNANQ